MTQQYYSPYPAQPQNPYPPSQTMAGWALGLAILSCLPFAWFVAIGLAIAVLVRSSDGRDHGKGKAIAALVIAGVWFAIGIVVGVVSLVLAPEPVSEDGRPMVSTADLGEGQCFNAPEIFDATGEESVDIERVEVVPCGQRHQFEIYHRQQLPGSDYPGYRKVVSQTEEFCVEEFGDFVGREYDRSELGLIYFHPQPRGWALGDHYSVCAIGEVNGRRVTGTLRHAER